MGAGPSKCKVPVRLTVPQKSSKTVAGPRPIAAQPIAPSLHGVKLPPDSKKCLLLIGKDFSNNPIAIRYDLETNEHTTVTRLPPLLNAKFFKFQGEFYLWL